MPAGVRGRFSRLTTGAGLARLAWLTGERKSTEFTVLCKKTAQPRSFVGLGDLARRTCALLARSLAQRLRSDDAIIMRLDALFVESGQKLASDFVVRNKGTC